LLTSTLGLPGGAVVAWNHATGSGVWQYIGQGWSIILPN
jgi:hypothetical protein